MAHSIYVTGLSEPELVLATNIISKVQAGASSGFDADAGYTIARNPVGSNDVLKYQNYLIPYASSVPEPGTMLLLGTSLTGLVFFGRRKLFIRLQVEDTTLFFKTALSCV